MLRTCIFLLRFGLHVLGLGGFRGFVRFRLRDCRMFASLCNLRPSISSLSLQRGWSCFLLCMVRGLVVVVMRKLLIVRRPSLFFRFPFSLSHLFSRSAWSVPRWQHLLLHKTFDRSRVRIRWATQLIFKNNVPRESLSSVLEFASATSSKIDEGSSGGSRPLSLRRNFCCAFLPIACPTLDFKNFRGNERRGPTLRFAALPLPSLFLTTPQLLPLE